MIKWIKEHWLTILIMVLVMIVMLVASGALSCWTGGPCPPTSNLTG